MTQCVCGVVPEEATGCLSGAPCQNRDKLAVDTSTRTLWTRRLSLGDPSLLHFAKRHPARVTEAATPGQHSASEESLVVSSSAPPPSAPPPSARAPIGGTPLAEVLVFVQDITFASFDYSCSF